MMRRATTCMIDHDLWPFVVIDHDLILTLFPSAHLPSRALWTVSFSSWVWYARYACAAVSELGFCVTGWGGILHSAEDRKWGGGGGRKWAPFLSIPREAQGKTSKLHWQGLCPEILPDPLFKWKPPLPLRPHSDPGGSLSSEMTEQVLEQLLEREETFLSQSPEGKKILDHPC